MSNEQTTGDTPCLEESDPTNAKLAALMVEQTGKVLRHLTRLEYLVGDPSPSPIEIANQIEDALREDAERETPKFSEFAFLYLKQLVLEIRCPRGPGPSEPAGSESDPVEYQRVEPEEVVERLTKPLIKADAQSKMIDRLLSLGGLEATEMGGAALALAVVFARDLPDNRLIAEIPEDWVPVVLAINPMTGEFLTVAGPRSGPDGRVEAVETMLARQMTNVVRDTLGAVREAGRPQPKPGKPDCTENVITGPIDEGTCEACRIMVGKRVSPGKAADYLRGIQVRCECENGCRLTLTHPDNLKAEEGS